MRTRGKDVAVWVASHVLAIAGLALVVVGVWAVSPPAALIVLGVALVIVGLASVPDDRFSRGGSA